MSDPNASPGGGSNHESWNQQGYGGGQYPGQYQGGAPVQTQHPGQYQGQYPGQYPGNIRGITRRMEPTAMAPAAGTSPRAPTA